MSTADRRAATAARFSSRAPVEPDERSAEQVEHDRDAALTADASPDVLGRRIPGTYKLYPGQYRAFGATLADAADEIGEARVTRQDGIEAALRLLGHDETVRRRWVAELREVMRERR